MRVAVVGAGVAGLVAARALAARRAIVVVFEARDRLGGRVLTVRQEGPSPVHAEAGGEFIDGDHTRVRALARELGLRLTRVLRSGFGTAVRYGGNVEVLVSQATGWRRLKRAFARELKQYESHGSRWEGTVAAELARRSVLDLLTANRAGVREVAFAQALQGFFAAGPSSLSALVLLDQMLDGDPGSVRLYRIAGGSDALVRALADEVGRVARRHVLRRVVQTGRGVTLTLESARGGLVEHEADYVVIAAPPPLVSTIVFTPPLPAAMRRALDALPLGAGTKSTLRFGSRWWHRSGRPDAFGTNMPVGAIWASAGDRRGPHALTLFAAGDASAQFGALLDREGVDGVVGHLTWLGTPRDRATLVSTTRWEHDEWARGTYAVFTPGFDPLDRAWLARAHGRVLFAGEHTSGSAQGYIEGAVESGQRAATEIESLVSLSHTGGV